MELMHLGTEDVDLTLRFLIDGRVRFRELGVRYSTWRDVDFVDVRHLVYNLSSC